MVANHRRIFRKSCQANHGWGALASPAQNTSGFAPAAFGSLHLPAGRVQLAVNGCFQHGFSRPGNGFPGVADVFQHPAQICFSPDSAHRKRSGLTAAGWGMTFIIGHLQRLPSLTQRLPRTRAAASWISALETYFLALAQ